MHEYIVSYVHSCRIFYKESFDHICKLFCVCLIAFLWLYERKYDLYSFSGRLGAISREVPKPWDFTITLKLDRHLVRSAAQIPVKHQNDTLITTTKFVASSLHEFRRWDALPLGEYSPRILLMALHQIILGYSVSVVVITHHPTWSWLWLYALYIICLFNPLRAKFFRPNIINIFTFYVIPTYWYDTGTQTPSSSKIRIYIFYIVNIMAANVLAT